MSSSEKPFFASSPPKTTLPVFTGIVWAGVGLSFSFVAFRAYARWKSFRRYFWDDFFVLFAWILILATAIMWHFVAANLFQISYVSSGKLSITHVPTLVRDTELYLRVSVAVIIFFYTSLWAVKVSFLIFFRKITAGTFIKAQIIQWWVVLGLTLATWFACLGSLEYNCLAAPLFKIAQHCSSPYSVRFQRVTLITNCAMDVLTDIMITSIPIVMLWKVKINLRQKIALTGIFSLTVVTMMFAIIRVAVVTRQTRTTPDSTWLYLWSTIEPPVAVIIACLASFRSLFKKQEAKSPIIRNDFHKNSGDSSRWMIRRMKTADKSHDMVDLTNPSTPSSHHENEVNEVTQTSTPDQVRATENV